MEHGGGEADAKGMGDRITRHKPLGTSRGLGRRLRPTGGGADVRKMEEGRGRKSTLDRRTPGADRDLDTGRGKQGGENRTRDASHRLARGTPCGQP